MTEARPGQAVVYIIGVCRTCRAGVRQVFLFTAWLDTGGGGGPLHPFASFPYGSLNASEQAEPLASGSSVLKSYW